MRLYELTEQWRCVAEIALAEAEAGELSAGLAEQLASIEGDIDTKLAACCRIVREMEAGKDAFAAEASRLRLKASRCEAHADSLKRYMKEQMEACCSTKREVDAIFTVAVQKSPPRLVINDIDIVPTTWDVTPARAVDTGGIKTAIQAGGTVPGCEIVQGTHLRIR